MGDYTYYSFSIEPDKLFKIGYVLHRNNANDDLMPTYQRIVKRTRLKQIQSFVSKGGFFPNSIIINVDAKNLRFDQSSLQAENSTSKIGVLHLPQQYMSAYIIDGQHRLYGYAGSPYAATSSLPVIAFVHLEKEQQIKMFMDINENQKAVPKNLRATLTADILSSSDIMAERQIALQSRIAQRLANDPLSPLSGRVLVGENVKTSDKYLTLESIQQAIEKSPLLDRYRKGSNEIVKPGILDTGNADDTELLVVNYLEDSLGYFKDKLTVEWIADQHDNFILSNRGIYGLIRIIGEILEQLREEDTSDVKSVVKSHSFPQKLTEYFDSVIDFYLSISDKEKNTLKKTYGASGSKLYWRTLEMAVNKKFSEFTPDGLKEFIRDHDLRFNTQTFDLLLKIEGTMRLDFKRKLISWYGEEWQSHVPVKVYQDVTSRMSAKNYKLPVSKRTDFWDNMMLIHYRSIALENWQNLFENGYSKEISGVKGHNKSAKTEWIAKLNDIRNKCDHSQAVSEDDFHFVRDVYTFIPKL